MIEKARDMVRNASITFFQSFSHLSYLYISNYGVSRVFGGMDL